MIKNKKNLGFTPTPTLKSRKKWMSGFTIMEVLIACSIISLSMFALIQTAQKGLSLSGEALRKAQASLLLEEGVEAVKSIRDNNWDTISSLSLDTPYHLYFNTTTKLWSLDTNTTSISGAIPTYPIDQIFNRTVTFYSVGRDANDDILTSGGTLDTRIKKVVVNTIWTSSNRTNTKNLSFYLADIFN